MQKHNPTSTSTLHVQTLLLKDIALSKMFDKSIYFKMECYQPSKSFKLRGIGYAMQQAIAKGYSKFICSSGGNAGCAVAWVGANLNLDVRIVVPKTTSQHTIQALENLNATVEVVGSVWDESNAYCLDLIQNNPDIYYIHPFNHPDLWHGHATMIDEIAMQMGEPDLIITSVGGGGLLSGILQGIEKYQWATHVLAVETEGANSFAQSLQAKELVSLDKITSKAYSLGAKQICEQALNLSLKLNSNLNSKLNLKSEQQVISYIVSDEDCKKACARFLKEQKTSVELACGASLSIIYDEKHIHRLKDYQKIIVIACGGIND